MHFTRFGIYYTPADQEFADAGASWLGWDIRTALARNAPCPDHVARPAKYGFHGTLKPPFRLKEGQTPAALEVAVSNVAGALSPAVCDGLTLTQLGGFLALTPFGPLDELQSIAGTCVRNLDGFRAPASEAELARRRQARLSTRQEALLAQWGYPYVFEEFRFHLTLSSRLPEEDARAWKDILQSQLPDLPALFVVDQIALCGERQDGCFELIHRYTLTG